MANRRMFSKAISNSAKFLKMPLETQALYFHLGQNADDDGVVEGFMVMRLIGSSEDSLRLLATKGYIKVLNEDLVVFVVDWLEHNKIRADRKVDSIYKQLLEDSVPDIQLLESKERADRKKDDHGTSQGQPRDGIGKDRLGQDKESLSSNHDEISKIVDYLNKKTGKSFKTSTNKTKSCINARIKEGFTLQDFTKVIDIKCKEWQNDSTMKKFLRPETLFGTKFEGYLNQEPQKKKEEQSRYRVKTY